MNLKYKDVFKVGDLVKCKERVEFCDGTVHANGEILYVSETTKYYYNFHTHIYELYKEK